MTAATPDEGDVQRVAEAISDELDKRGSQRSQRHLLARAAIAALDLPARDARVAAEAWDEGYAVGRDDEFDRVPDRANPHREAKP